MSDQRMPLRPGPALVPAAQTPGGSSLLLLATSVLDREIFNAEQESEWRSHLAILSDAELDALSVDAICGGLRDRIDRLTRAYREEVADRRRK